MENSLYMVIFHSYVNVYQRLYLGKSPWIRKSRDEKSPMGFSPNTDDPKGRSPRMILPMKKHWNPPLKSHENPIEYPIESHWNPIKIIQNPRISHWNPSKTALNPRDLWRRTVIIPAMWPRDHHSGAVLGLEVVVQGPDGGHRKARAGTRHAAELVIEVEGLRRFTCKSVGKMVV